MTNWVEITFDCLPLRSVSRLDAPLDASPKLAAKLLRIKQAMESHGTHNTYYLHNSNCCYHLTNDPKAGSIAFKFEGTVFTDAEDIKAIRTELQVTLDRETCDWLNQSVVEWLSESVHRSVVIEFDRYIAAGDLEKTRQRLAQIERTLEESQGYVGMYL
ncbi:MAG: hypothetical protein SGI77_07500 [Pirellulaceae bacterium]|nr:hypothetical protein [Pirellulaceae bacterium]